MDDKQREWLDSNPWAKRALDVEDMGADRGIMLALVAVAYEIATLTRVERSRG